MTEDQPAAIQATFSDVKLIRSRKGLPNNPRDTLRAG
jgi:hypothetical protein